MMTVAQLIEELKKYPQDLPVVAIDGTESNGFIDTSIKVCDPKDPYYERIWDTGTPYEGPYLFIAGY